MNCIKVKRNNLLNSIYSSVSPDFRFKETPYVNVFTDQELSSSLYNKSKANTCISFSNIISYCCNYFLIVTFTSCSRMNGIPALYYNVIREHGDMYAVVLYKYLNKM